MKTLPQTATADQSDARGKAGRMLLERVAGIEIQDSQLAYDVLPFC